MSKGNKKAIMIGILIALLIFISSKNESDIDRKLSSNSEYASFGISCNSNTDCPSPIKNDCPGLTKGCIQNECAYNISTTTVCLNEFAVLLKEYKQAILYINEQIMPTKYSLSFSLPPTNTIFNFGDEPFTASKTQFKCSRPLEGSLNAPAPNADCWRTNISFWGKLFDMKHGDTFVYSNYINVTYTATGRIFSKIELEENPEKTAEKEEASFSNNFVVSIKDPLQFEVISGQKYVVKDSNHTVHLVIDNKLPSNSKAVVRVRQIAKQTNQILEQKDTAISLKHGKNDYFINADTSNYGTNELIILVLYPVGNIIIGSNQLTTNYIVKSEIPLWSSSVFVKSEDEKIKSEEQKYVPSDSIVRPSTINLGEIDLEKQGESPDMLTLLILIGSAFILLIFLKNDNKKSE